MRQELTHLPLGVHHDVARRMMPEPGCSIPLVVVPGTLWRFGEPAACRRRGRPLHRMCVVRLRLPPLRRGAVDCSGHRRLPPDRRERGQTLGRLAWQAGAGQLPAGSGTFTVEVHGTAGAWEPSRGGRDHDHVAG